MDNQAFWAAAARGDPASLNSIQEWLTHLQYSWQSNEVCPGLHIRELAMKNLVVKFTDFKGQVWFMTVVDAEKSLVALRKGSQSSPYFAVFEGSCLGSAIFQHFLYEKVRLEFAPWDKKVFHINGMKRVALTFDFDEAARLRSGAQAVWDARIVNSKLMARERFPGLFRRLMVLWISRGASPAGRCAIAKFLYEADRIGEFYPGLCAVRRELRLTLVWKDWSPHYAGNPYFTPVAGYIYERMRESVGLA